MPNRTIAIGDIHGCLRAFDTLIEAIKPGSEDLVVTLGDYINRGPDSKGVLDRLLDLEQRCHLVPILGNHDQMLLDVHRGRYPIDWLLEIGGTATLDSYGPGRSLALIPDAHIEFLQRCHSFFETDDHIFIHANYYPDLPMAEQPAAMLRWESLRELTPRPHESGKVVIAGHTSQKRGEILDLGHVKCIDTFCHGGGWLTALEVHTGEVWQANQAGKMRSLA